MREESAENEMLDMIDDCATQASRIFEDFLDFVRETPIKKSQVGLGKIIEEGVKLAETSHENGQVTICKKIPANLTVAGDESKLKRVIMNLVKNGIDALGHHKTKNPHINIFAELDKKTNRVVVTVHDNGPGIPAEIIKRVFDPFVTKKKVNGTGLGLAIVKQYITAHGGEVKVENDEGAVFTIRLPLE
jgi:signal transduction histidine kinase